MLPSDPLASLMLSLSLSRLLARPLARSRSFTRSRARALSLLQERMLHKRMLSVVAVVVKGERAHRHVSQTVLALPSHASQRFCQRTRGRGAGGGGQIAF